MPIFYCRAREPHQFGGRRLLHQIHMYSFRLQPVGPRLHEPLEIRLLSVGSGGDILQRGLGVEAE